MQNGSDTPLKNRVRLPSPRWLPVAAMALAAWAVGLGLWYRQLSTPWPVPTPQPSAGATSLPRTRATLAAPLTPVALSTPVLTALERQPNAAVSQEDWLALADSFDARQAAAYIAELASATYAGRAVGSAGGRLAAEWIAQRFAEYDLQPAGTDGSYFQEFPVPYGELTAMPAFDRIDESGQTLKSYRFRQDYSIVLGGYADGGRAEGPLIWLSNGAPEDYAGLDATGAIILCRYRGLTEEALRQALEHGVQAVLFARTDQPDFRFRRLVREDALLPQGIPALFVGAQVTQDLLEGSGLSPDDLTILYKPRALATRVRLDLPFSYEQGRSGQNVLGVLPGSDPDGRDQWVVVGAHYDHLGADPDGTLWGGANDNASGVAVLLEIARQWKEQGYVPRRSVLFAAWDGEENGLWGSTYYVQHPRHALTSTMGMLALDMVGGGTDRLFVDSGGIVADQSLAAALLLGIPDQEQSMGRSDHAPFVGAGVPATLYIWWDGVAPGVVYHVPQDDLANIAPAKLKATGVLANVVLLDLSWDQEQIEDLAERRREALATADVATLLGSLDPENAALQRQEQAWLASLTSRGITEPAVLSAAAIIASNSAKSNVTLSYRQGASTGLTTVTFPARWIRRGLDWYYAGPSFSQSAGEHVLVESLPPFAQGDLLAAQADALYERLGQETGLTLPLTLTVRAYGSADVLRALEAPAVGLEEASAWSQAGLLALGSSSALTNTMLQAALQRAGWPSAEARWLAAGMEDQLAAGDPQQRRDLEARYLPLLLQGDANGALWPPQSMPNPDSLNSSQRKLWSAQAWAMTDYLLRTVGPAALQQLSLAGVEAWRDAFVSPWHAASLGISDTLAQRSKAVLDQDQAAFLATVDATDRTLLQEEQHWFADLRIHPADEFKLTGKLVALDGSQATADVEMTYHLAEASSVAEKVTWRASFAERNGRWLYADMEHQEARSDHFIFKYAGAERPAFTEDLLAQAERAYASVTSDLDWRPAQPVEIKFYPSQQLFRTSIYLSMLPAHGWAEPGESIKLTDLTTALTGRVIAHELSHMALFAKGVQHGALHEGTGQYEAGQFDPHWQDQQIRKWRQQVYDLVRSDRPLTFASMTDWRELQEELDLMYSVGWDTVTYFRAQYGRGAFLRWLDALGSGLSLEAAFSQATGVPWTDFEAAWRASVLRGHIGPQDTATALTMDGQAALEHVQTLAQPDWRGREAGTPGNQAAAQYIAQRFAEYGMQPAGDAGSYFQSFAISQTALLTTPVFALLDANGRPLKQFKYREDFRELIRGNAGGGQASGEIVYVSASELGELRLGGRVLLIKAGSDTLAMAKEAYEHGAGGLLLATDTLTTSMPLKSDYLPSLEAHTLPVFLLAKGISDDLLQLAGYQAAQSRNAPPAQLLALGANLDVRLAVTPTTQAANVLGVLPGSDPSLRDQVLVVGAHLDHVGSLPDGSIYAGANDDASGVGVLLEIARLWQQRGYRPRRTVLFAAWNAEEMGLLGSRYYVSNPAFPLTSTLAMLQLDMVGQGSGFYVQVSGDETQEARILAHLDGAARQVEVRVNLEKYEGGSDHDSFHQAGVPAAVLSWERAENYHLPTDTADTLDARKLQASGRLAALALMTMADE